MTARIYILTLISIILAGCTDLTAVNKWSTTATDAARFNKIVAAYADTPKRMQRYTSLPKEGENEQHKARLEALEAQALTRGKQAETIQETMRVVEAYMATLATLSGGTSIDISDDVGTVTAN